MGNTKGNTTKGKGKGTKGTTPTTNNPVQVVPYTPTTPKVRTGSSTVPNPVGVVWVTCINLTHNNGGNLHPRKVYTSTCIGLGVTYYTVRTQVNRYLQWVNGGCVGNTPRTVQVPSGVNLTPTLTTP